MLSIWFWHSRDCLSPGQVGDLTWRISPKTPIVVVGFVNYFGCIAPSKGFLLGEGWGRPTFSPPSHITQFWVGGCTLCTVCLMSTRGALQIVRYFFFSLVIAMASRLSPCRVSAGGMFRAFFAVVWREWYVL